MPDQIGPAARLEIREPGIDRLGRLHRSVVRDPAHIRRLLGRLGVGGRLIGTGQSSDPEPAPFTIRWLRGGRFAVDGSAINADDQAQVYLQFDLEGVRYFFSARPLQGGGDEPLEIELPEAVYESERREDFRYEPGEMDVVPRQVRLVADGVTATAAVSDWSRHGLGVKLPAGEMNRLAFPLRVLCLGGGQDGGERFAVLRHRVQRGKTVHLGLATSAVPDGAAIAIERGVVGDSAPGGWRRVMVPARPRAAAGQSPTGTVRLVEYPNDRGEPIRALVNTTTEPRGGTAVVIPPSWGGTKERTLGLAAALVETFERAGEPLVVVRFDGTHRRGESWIDPAFRDDGDESLGFTFSQAARDVRSTFEYVERGDTFAASRVILVTFSLGAIDGRRALAGHRSNALAGWISVVGVPDLQSGMRRVSGGIDYVQGWERGLRWGVQELLGVRADIDRTGQDALDHELVYFDDARRDMARITVPISWFHGRYDGWVDLERVERLLVAGETQGRRIVEIPHGHQMRSSREAMRIFERIAEEAAEMALGRTVAAVSPDVRAFARLEKAERKRLAAREVDVREFWSDYLLGENQSLGIELMTATRSYRAFMSDQVRMLDVPDGGLVLDVGSGTGDLALNVARQTHLDRSWRLVAVDFVTDALRRGRRRVASARTPSETLAGVHSIAADLDVASAKCRIPLADASVDGVVASLLLSYLSAPACLLDELRRVIRPGGCLVASTMRRDADISKLYVEGVAELPPDRVRAYFGAHSDAEVEVFQRHFLNNAARLLRLEEEGRFRFWDADEFEGLFRAAGFEDIEIRSSFGVPAQAHVLRARSPR